MSHNIWNKRVRLGHQHEASNPKAEGLGASNWQRTEDLHAMMSHLGLTGLNACR